MDVVNPATGEVVGVVLGGQKVRYSDSLKEFAPAFVKAQTAMPVSKKDSVNPFFRSSYADMASVRESALPHLNANGIGVIQSPTTDGVSKVKVTTRLLHVSGEWMESDLEFSVVPMKQDKDPGQANQAVSAAAAPKQVTPQAFGSAISYARRYALEATVCGASEEDDGNASSAKPHNLPQVQRPVAGSTSPSPDEHLRKIQAGMAAAETQTELDSWAPHAESLPDTLKSQARGAYNTKQLELRKAQQK